MSIVLDKELEFKTVYSFYISFYAHMQALAKQKIHEINKEIFVEVDWLKVRMSKSVNFINPFIQMLKLNFLLSNMALLFIFLYPEQS